MSTIDHVSDEEWDQMKAMISTQIDNVPKDCTVQTLRSRGSLECVAQQIQRGDENPSARLQAWYLAMLEIEVTSRPLGLSKIDYLFSQHSKDGLKSFVLDTTMNETCEDDDEWKRRSIVAKLEGKANLNYVERQQLWQAKKESALNNMRKKEETKAARERKMSAPDLTKSRKSFRTQSGQKRPGGGDDGSLNNITNTNQAGNSHKRIRTDKKMTTAPKPRPTGTRRQSIR